MSANGLMVLEPVLTSWPGLGWDEGVPSFFATRTAVLAQCHMKTFPKFTLLPLSSFRLLPTASS